MKCRSGCIFQLSRSSRAFAGLLITILLWLHSPSAAQPPITTDSPRQSITYREGYTRSFTPGRWYIADTGTGTTGISYHDNIITFIFAEAGYHQRSSGLQYRYKFVPLDKDWQYAGSANQAMYINLKPGRYTFWTEVRNDRSAWSRQGEPLSVCMLPSHRQINWYKILLFLILPLFLYIMYRFRLHQASKLEQLRNDIARDLHDEIGSALSTISLYSSIVQKHDDKPGANPYVLMKRINENTTQVIEAVSDIVWSINTRNDKFENIISRMQQHAVQLLEAKGYTVHFSVDERLEHKSFDTDKRKNFYLIYKEAVNNIVKYADGSNVWIHADSHKSSLTLVITDDGKGFDVNHLRSSGNGLTNMQSRAAGIGGEMSVTSEAGRGTKIRVEIPCR